MRLVNRGIVVSVSLVFSLALSLDASPALAAGVPLTGYSVRDVVVDAAHQHVFLSQGVGRPSIVVTDYQGDVVTTIAESGPADMVLDGSTLYVVLVDANEVAKINTATLADDGAAISAGAATPVDGTLAMAGGLLWFTFGDCGDGSGVASVSPSGGTVHIYSGSPFPCGGGPQPAPLFGSPTDPSLLFGGQGIKNLTEYDATTDPPTVVGSWTPTFSSLIGVEDAAVTADGTKIEVADGYEIEEIRVSDMKSTGRIYLSRGMTSVEAVATTGADGGFLAMGGHSRHSVDLFSVGSKTIQSSQLRGGYVCQHGAAFTPDGSLLFVLTGDPFNYYCAGPLSFHVIDQPATFSPGLTLTASAKEVTAGGKVKVTAHLGHHLT